MDCLITTLTIAHIKNIDEAISSWSRVLKNGGDLIITDFHPVHAGREEVNEVSVMMARVFRLINYVHPLEKVKRIFSKYGLAPS